MKPIIARYGKGKSHLWSGDNIQAAYCNIGACPIWLLELAKTLECKRCKAILEKLK